jgi:hypothetical protein
MPSEHKPWLSNGIQESLEECIFLPFHKGLGYRFMIYGSIFRRLFHSSPAMAIFLIA